MRKIAWIVTALIFLIISLIINFNSTSITSFFTSSLIFGLITFGTFTLIVNLIQNIKYKNTPKTILFGTLSVASIIVVSFALFMFFSGGICLTAITPQHFRTNIFTGKCDFGGYSGCVSSDPWYYKPDCDSNAEKLKAIKSTKYYKTRFEECEKFCKENDQSSYCGEFGSHTWGNGPADINCEELIKCDSISCS